MMTINDEQLLLADEYAEVVEKPNFKTDLNEANATIKRLIAELQQIKAEQKEAAGELLVSMPEPGSDTSKLLHANTMMRKYRIPDLEEQIVRLEAENKRIFDVIEHAEKHLGWCIFCGGKKQPFKTKGVKHETNCDKFTSQSPSSKNKTKI